MNFEFTPSLGIGRSVNFEYNINDALNKFTNISVLTYYKNQENIYDEFLKELSRERNICISILGYYCPWDWRYNEYSEGVHAFFVVDYNEIEKKFICVDPYYNLKNIEIKSTNVQKGIQSFRIFKLSSKKEEYNKLELLEKELIYVINKKIIDSFSELGRVIQKNFFIEYEILDYCENESCSMDELHRRMFLNQTLKKIVHNFIRFSVLLKYYANHSPHLKEDFLNLSNEMVVISEKWEIVRFQLLKMIYSENYESINKSIGRRFILLTGELKDLIIRIVLLLQNKKIKIDLLNQSEINFSGIEQINIKSYFNNKGFFEPHSKTFGLDGMNASIIFESIHVDQDPEYFELTKQERNLFDNISCQQQRIRINTKEYCTGIFILACSDLKDIREHIIINYNDDTHDKILIHFYDWSKYSFKKNNNTMVISCKKINADSGNVSNSFIYGNWYGVSKEKRIKSIQLPECENIHIFCISMGISDAY